jgi:hypothetical protein
VILATAWPEFALLTPEDLARDGKRRLLIDCWRLLDRAVFADACDIVWLGNGEMAGEGTEIRTAAAQ